MRSPVLLVVVAALDVHGTRGRVPVWLAWAVLAILAAVNTLLLGARGGG